MNADSAAAAAEFCRINFHVTLALMKLKSHENFGHRFQLSLPWFSRQFSSIREAAFCYAPTINLTTNKC